MQSASFHRVKCTKLHDNQTQCKSGFESLDFTISLIFVTFAGETETYFT